MKLLLIPIYNFTSMTGILVTAERYFIVIFITSAAATLVLVLVSF